MNQGSDLKFIRGLLTRDHINRVTRNWPLLSEEELSQIWNNTKSFRLNKPLECEEECFVSDGKSRGYGNLDREEWSSVSNSAKKLLLLRPHLEELLISFQGRLVLAGGSVFNATRGFLDASKDLDFFFVDPEVDRSPNSEQYTSFLQNILIFLASRWLYSNPEKNTRNVYILRSEHVTTVRLIGIDEDIKYQFIHRVYPSIGSILGGFDIGPSMLAFDGKNILSTEFGAWCSFSRTIIIDTTRRSTSYEHRLRKYSFHCRIVFPGLPPELTCEEKSNWKEQREVFDLLKTSIKNNGFRIIKDRFYVMEKVYTYDRDKVVSKMRKVAGKLGWTLKNPEDLDLVNILEENEAVKDVEEMKRILERQAYENGYILSFYMFLEHAKKKEISSTKLNEFLEPRKRVKKLPFLCINLEPNKDWSVGPYSDSLIRNDYEDNPVWPSYTTFRNLTNLVLDRISYVNSVLILAPEEIRLMNPEPERNDISHVLNSIQTCFRTAKNLEEITFFICQSFYSPSFGNITEAFKHKLNSINGWEISKTVAERLSSTFGAQTEKIQIDIQGKFQKKLNKDLIEILRKGIESNLKEAERRLKDNFWILKNPGRQWTSSINPIIANPRKWYGSLYSSFRIGCKEIETMLRLGRRSPECPFHRMDINIFKYIVRLVVWENSFL